MTIYTLFRVKVERIPNPVKALAAKEVKVPVDVSMKQCHQLLHRFLFLLAHRRVRHEFYALPQDLPIHLHMRQRTSLQLIHLLNNPRLAKVAKTLRV